MYTLPTTWKQTSASLRKLSGPSTILGYLVLMRTMSDSCDPIEGDFQIPEEDTIVYRLYTLHKDESLLSQLAADCNQHAQSISRNHIWHYDRFSLEVCAGKNRGEPPSDRWAGTLCTYPRVLVIVLAYCTSISSYSIPAFFFHHDCHSGSDALPCLYGSTCFRDNLDDEWLIVYLLYSISRLYTQLVIRSVQRTAMM